MITLHAYAGGEELLVSTDPEPLVQEVAPGTVMVFVQGLAIQVQESVEQIATLIKKDESNGS